MSKEKVNWTKLTVYFVWRYEWQSGMCVMKYKLLIKSGVEIRTYE